MSTLVARILLSLFMFPLGIVVYFVSCLYYARRTGWGSEDYLFIMAGITTWVFMAAYWRQVKWNPRRVTGTAVAALLAIGISYGVGMMVTGIERSIGAFAGSIVAPILWLIATVFLWKET